MYTEVQTNTCWIRGKRPPMAATENTDTPNREVCAAAETSDGAGGGMSLGVVVIEG